MTNKKQQLNKDGSVSRRGKGGGPKLDKSPIAKPQDGVSKRIKKLEEAKEFKFIFVRDKLPDLYKEIDDPKDALKAYTRHLIVSLVPREEAKILFFRACKNQQLFDSIYDLCLSEMTFDYRSKDKILIEGYFEALLQTGMKKAIETGDLKSFFSGAKLMKDLYGIETRKLIRAEIAGKSASDIFGKEFLGIVMPTEFGKDFKQLAKAEREIKRFGFDEDEEELKQEIQFEEIEEDDSSGDE